MKGDRMGVLNIITLLGGLALFLYGMLTMGEGLIKLSGGKLEQILAKLTKNRVAALCLGCIVTAIIQSSSATTVMVVGFVNAGIMKLGQAVGVIMGANIGTTATSWLLSLTGLEGDEIWVKLLKPSSFSPLLALIGVILLMLKSQSGSKQKMLGTIFIGFAILMTGMETMSNSVSSLSDSPRFTSLLTAFSNPVMGVLSGLLLTVIIQSSSASIGILQALCSTGSITYGAAIPIILGQNIGTCVTAILSSIGTCKNARRASLIHLYFNLLGTIGFMVLFYVYNTIFRLSFLESNASIFGIAVFHTIFNLATAVLLIPFANSLVKLSILTLPDTPEDNQKHSPIQAQSLLALDERFLTRPSFAIKLCQTATKEMVQISLETFQLTQNNMKEYVDERYLEIVKKEEETDSFEDVIGSYLTKLTSHSLSYEDSRFQAALLHSIDDVERIADLSVKVAGLTKNLQKEGTSFSPEAWNELDRFGKAVNDILFKTASLFEKEELFAPDNIAKAKMIEPLEDVINKLYHEIKKRHMYRLLHGQCTEAAGLILIDIIRNYERIADHCTKIAITLIELESDDYKTHEYREQSEKERSVQFQDEYKQLSQTYTLS